MFRHWVSIVAGLVVGCAVMAARTNAEDSKSGQRTPQTRKFEFTYGATISDLAPGAKARVWVPVATSNHEQKVELKSVRVPTKYRQTTEKQMGNRVVYFEAAADASGQIPLDLKYVVERRELLLDQSEKVRVVPATFLSSDKMVPVDGTLLKKVMGDEKPSGQTLDVARRIYDAVNDRMKYSKPDGKPWGRGDAVWACDSRYGNCTDFHSLFIAVSRDLKIPAKFEMGFSIPEKRGSGEVAGYHCWAKFVDRQRWVAVDISEANKEPKLKDYYFGNLTADRVTFTTGRDLALDPPPAAGPVNFLVFPYVEVDGKPHAKLMKRFAYKDVE
jgi:transglutaminase-like putative cysteine protease